MSRIPALVLIAFLGHVHVARAQHSTLIDDEALDAIIAETSGELGLKHFERLFGVFGLRPFPRSRANRQRHRRADANVRARGRAGGHVPFGRETLFLGFPHRALVGGTKRGLVGPRPRNRARPTTRRELRRASGPPRPLQHERRARDRARRCRPRNPAGALRRQIRRGKDRTCLRERRRRP